MAKQPGSMLHILGHISQFTEQTTQCHFCFFSGKRVDPLSPSVFVFAVVCRLKSTATARCVCVLWSLLSRYLLSRVYALCAATAHR